MSITITTNDLNGVVIGQGRTQPEILLFAAADTFVKGTILARKLVSDTITVTPDGGNTGDYTLVATARPGRTLKIGTYVLTAGDLTAGVGPWTLTDPDGDTDTFTTSAAGDDLTFEHLGVNVVVTVVTTAFDDGDTADLVVAAQSGTPLVPFDPAGTGGEQNPLAVLPYEVTKTSGGNLAIDALVAGEVNKTRLIIDVDGDGDNITAVHLDALRAAGVTAVAVQQLAELDNGAS